jgi:uncharacterized protein YcbK (DUF882 family)
MSAARGLAGDELMANSWKIGPVFVLSLLAIASLAILARAETALGPRADATAHRRPLPTASAAPSALGRSRGVRMHTALPGQRLTLPLELNGSPDEIHYAWVPLGDLNAAAERRPLAAALFAPSAPGFYRLAISREGQQQVVQTTIVGVLKPMAEKRGGAINGYRIGFYRGERGRTATVPPGFLEVDEAEAALEVSEHLTLGDFITHDGQTQWPRYVALSPRLLDKLELVFDEIARWRGSEETGSVSVTSGFRTPLHNRRVRRAAGDSRHQYGDAADIAVDANGDGRITSVDAHLIGRAVEAVERRHPDLVGGLGVYTRTGSPYAHVDVRGTRARWRG